MPGMSELLIVLVIVFIIFGSKKIKTLGSDLGSAIKGFRKAVSTDEESQDKDVASLEVDPADDPDATLIPDKDSTKNEQ